MTFVRLAVVLKLTCDLKWSSFVLKSPNAVDGTVNPTNYPVNMPDPIRKRFGYGQLWPLRPACSQNLGRTVKLCRIRLPTSVSAPFFQRRHGSYCAKPTRIRSGWPGQGLAKRIRSGSKPVCRNHRPRFLGGRNRAATSFPLSDSVPIIHRRPGSYCSKPPGSDLVCISFWPNGSGPEASRCARIIRPASGQRCRSDPDGIRHV